ncbi:unnamed protein product [Moneuplotes crassus]|uniref:Uncharacterized protein n=1 Tax=Euplotes crassus TaxID=5936 RepID=A0AAD1UCS4_EUPCR|nr:unnamed protein product [Moneuplotes crassus]
MEARSDLGCTFDTKDTSDPDSKNKSKMERILREKSIQQQCQQIDHKICTSLFKNIRGERTWKEFNGKIILQCCKLRDRKLLEQCSNFRLPWVTSIVIRFAYQSRRRVNKFLNKSITNKTQLLQIHEERRAFPRYLNQLSKASSTIGGKLRIFEFRRMNLKQLKRIFSANRNKSSLWIMKSTFCLPPQPDFSKCFSGTSLESLVFAGSSIHKRKCNPKNLHNLDTLFFGLATSPDLKNSLQNIKVAEKWYFNRHCEVDISQYGFLS